MSKSAPFAFLLSLLLLAHDASAGIRPRMSFGRGFSSHVSSLHASSPRSGFGFFRSRPAAQPAPQRSNSALSRQLDRDAAQARALHTLDQRNAARTAPAPNAPQPAPGYAQSAPAQPANASAPTTVIVHQGGGGLGHVIAGAMIAHSMNAHAQAGYYPAPGPRYNDNGSPGAAQAGGATSFFGLFLTLCLLVAIAWGLWFAWKGVQRRRAASKPNYSFERN